MTLILAGNMMSSSFCWILLVLVHILCFVSSDEDSLCFKGITNSAAGKPSSLWSDSLRSGGEPLPTNAFWQNFVLADGVAPEFIHPYSVRSRQGVLSFCHPRQVIQPSTAQVQVHRDDFSVSIRENSSPFVVSSFDDLSVTLSTQQSDSLVIPLVRGSPYITLVLQNATPNFSSINSILGLVSSSDRTKHWVYMNNSQTWLIYSSAPLTVSFSFSSGSLFTGVIRVALLTKESSEQALDLFSSCYPTSGSMSIPAAFTMRFEYKTGGSCMQPLLMLSLPMQRGVLVQENDSTSRLVPSVKFESVDGTLEGITGSVWVLSLPPVNVSWFSSRGISVSAAVEEISSALQQDVSNLSRIIQTPTTYFFGKAAARAARLALIAMELNRGDLLDTIAFTLRNWLDRWLDDEQDDNSIGYDSVWSGLISSAGARDTGADFGLGVYNDHHFHWGYFVYAGAVLAKLDPDWGRQRKCKLYALMSDYMQPYRSGTARFARLRHFDPWLMHSWASGLTLFADGRNQESTSEAVNAYYSASLLGDAFGDEELKTLGLTLTAFETRGAVWLWHVPLGSQLYDARFVAANRVVGVLWANKRDPGLWFEPASSLEVRLGIQVLPLTPVTEVLFAELGFNQELAEWAYAGPRVSDGWKGFVCALQASYDPDGALEVARRLAGYDDGNSASNLLWWIHSRR